MCKLPALSGVHRKAAMDSSIALIASQQRTCEEQREDPEDEIEVPMDSFVNTTLAAKTEREVDLKKAAQEGDVICPFL
jgi:hypothetical protein